MNVKPHYSPLLWYAMSEWHLIHGKIILLLAAIRQSTWTGCCCWKWHSRNFIQAAEDTSLGNVESRPSAVHWQRCSMCRCQRTRVIKEMSCMCRSCTSRKLWAFCALFANLGVSLMGVGNKVCVCCSCLPVTCLIEQQTVMFLLVITTAV